MPRVRGRSKEDQSTTLGGCRSAAAAALGIHAARALLSGPEGSPERADEPLERWPSHGLLRARALLAMLLDHRVAEEEAAALEGLTEDVELVSRHWRDGREPGRVETAERGRHLRSHAKRSREGHVRVCCVHGGCQAYHLAVLGEISLVHGLVRGRQVSGRVEVGKKSLLPSRTRTRGCQRGRAGDLARAGGLGGRAGGWAAGGAGGRGPVSAGPAPCAVGWHGCPARRSG